MRVNKIDFLNKILTVQNYAFINVVEIKTGFFGN